MLVGVETGQPQAPLTGLSANLRCTSETCCTWLAINTRCKKSPKICHLGTIAQLYRTISLQLSHVSTIGKKNLLSSNISSTSPQYGELRPALYIRQRRLSMQYCLKLSSTARNPAYSGLLAGKFKLAFDRKPNQIPPLGIRVQPDLLI